MRTRLFLATAAAALLATPAVAQRPVQTFGQAAFRMPAAYKIVQRAQLDAQRRLLLAMADSMPENLYRDRVTAPQRDFAQQLHHVVSSSVMIAGHWVGSGGPAGPAADTAAVFNTRAGLRAYINASYDYLNGVLDRTSEDDRHLVVDLFGTRMPRWQVWDELNQHASWTLGQVVANFRKQGQAPPPFLFF